MSKEEVIGRKGAKASGVGTFHIGYGSDFLPPPRELIKTVYEVKHLGFGFNTSIWPTVSRLLHMGTNLGPGRPRWSQREYDTLRVRASKRF